MLRKLFGRPDVKETVKKSKTDIRKGVRDIERELQVLRREEQRLIADIKAAARTQNAVAMRALAKALVRLRGQIGKLTGSSAQLRGVSTSLTAAATTNTVAVATQSATRAMIGVQKALPVSEVGKAMRDFSKESARLAAAEELVGETLEGALDGCGEEEEEDEAGDIVSQLLDEIGVGLAAASPAAPRAGALARNGAGGVRAAVAGNKASPAASQQQPAEVLIAAGSGDDNGAELDKLAMRLAGLRGQ